MTITLRFTDQDVTRNNAKAARAWLRSNRMNVAQAIKNGDTWVFEFSLANPVLYVKGKTPKKTQRQPTKPKSKAIPGMSAVSTGAVALTKSRSAVLPDRPKARVITNTAVKGSDLQPDDCLLNIVPYHDLTIDYRGIHQIVHSASNITRQRQEYLGFYSQESGGLLSYRIEKEEVYDVIRG